MNLIFLASLLTAVNFGWNTPAPEEGVSKIVIRIANSVAEHDSGLLYEAGYPPVIDNKQSFVLMVDTSTTKWAWIGFQNSWGVQEGPAMRLGKPGFPTGTSATP